MRVQSPENGERVARYLLESTRRAPSLECRQPHKIRYKAVEWAAIVEQARSCGRPPARYVRETSLGSAPKPRRGRQNDDVIHELGRIGASLSQLVSTAHESGAGAHRDRIEAVLADLLTAVRRLT
jgi:mobilization protein NikA